MIATIHSMRVAIDGSEIGVTNLTLDLKMPGAKETNRDLAEFSTFHSVKPGQSVIIVFVDQDGKHHNLFEGEIKTVNMTKQGDMMVSVANCAA